MRTPSVDAVVAGLSGGNQQKIVLAKWLAANARILILDEPTRGVDVGAKAEIHALIGELAARGAAILVISSELPEVISLSERIVVLREGRVAGELSRQEATRGLRAPPDGRASARRQASSSRRVIAPRSQLTAFAARPANAA